MNALRTPSIDGETGNVQSINLTTEGLRCKDFGGTSADWRCLGTGMASNRRVFYDSAAFLGDGPIAPRGGGRSAKSGRADADHRR